MKYNELFSILNNLFGGVYYVNKKRKIEYWNKEAEQITGFKKEEVVGKYCYDNILKHIDGEGNNLCKEGCPLHATMNDGKKREAEVYLHHKNGHRVPVLIRSVPIKDKSKAITGAVELFLENHTRVSLEQKLNELQEENFTDELTNISNRKHLEKILGELIEGENFENKNIAFCFLDIDDFKDINDNYGHLMGDKVLTMVANTLDKNLRPSDKVFRWGGDEFSLILFDIENKKSLLELLKRLKILVNNSYLHYENEKISVTMSFGATIIKDHDGIKTLTDRADSYLYESKKKGKNLINIS
ncbi:MAG: sensor domain-containing diguanylate cyclase [Halanaerobiales bacterium]